MQPDPVHVPCQGDDETDLQNLLLAALDGGDPLRAAMVLRLIDMRADRDRADAIERMREIGIPDVFRL